MKTRTSIVLTFGIAMAIIASTTNAQQSAQELTDILEGKHDLPEGRAIKDKLENGSPQQRAIEQTLKDGAPGSAQSTLRRLNCAEDTLDGHAIKLKMNGGDEYPQVQGCPETNAKSKQQLKADRDAAQHKLKAEKQAHDRVMKADKLQQQQQAHLRKKQEHDNALLMKKRDEADRLAAKKQAEVVKKQAKAEEEERKRAAKAANRGNGGEFWSTLWSEPQK